MPGYSTWCFLSKALTPLHHYLMLLWSGSVALDSVSPLRTGILGPWKSEERLACSVSHVERVLSFCFTSVSVSSCDIVFLVSHV